MTDRKIVQNVNPFVVTVNGVPLSVGHGDLYYADDPILQGREALFSEVAVKSSAYYGGARPEPAGPVETATSEPGGRRRMSRAPRTETKTLPEKLSEPDGEV